jgi:type III pantothenate kinase
MLLVVDAGNTNIVLGLFENGSLVRQWRITTGSDRTADEIRITLRNLLGEAGTNPSDIAGVAIASVVPSLNGPLSKALSGLLDANVRFLTASTSPILLDVESPGAVGADRIANCVAAHALYGGPSLVVDFGTATTFDLVGGDGRFLGGAIAPEMHLAARALTERAAQLYSVELDIPPSVIGKTTATNIQAGVVLGFLDLVSGLISRFRHEVTSTLPVVATGGEGALFHRHVKAIEYYDPVLTLKGLQLWWARSYDSLI